MPPKDKKRKSSPTGSSGSRESDSSASSYGLRELFETLPPAPPSERVLRNARNLDPESLREIPQRTPWSPAGSNEWFYRVGNKVASGIKSSASSSAKWVAENDTRLIESLGVGGGAILQGAGIAGQPAAAPSSTSGQAAYGGGVTISGLVSGYRGVKELSKLWWNYKHPGETAKKVNYAQMSLDLAAAGFAGVYGGYSTGTISSASTAQMGMAVGAIGSGLAAGASPWFQSQQPTPAPPAPLPPVSSSSSSTAPPAGYQLDTPYHASMTSLTQQMQGYQLSDLSPHSTRHSSVSTSSDPYGQPPAPAPYPRQPYTSGSYNPTQQPYTSGSYNPTQQSYQQGNYYPQNPVSSSASTYSYYPTDGQNSQQSGYNTTRHRGGHQHQGSQHQRQGGSGPSM
ncbi:hypothetical protein [Streptomyces griseoflavus]|uniref:Uncharacterized protein n=1 Tax=Streptomyces griseoflavus Tu4000 TaxID=467200 RepID=D9XJQ6_9ACTN|nr:hypothetical protein [Streptomyces griseoflavus]EFL40152.1 conserved hypothetical protein [Streptomyces griseoflavus Tu4000]